MTFSHIKLDHLPQDHLQGIGLVAVSWAFLEGALERIIWAVARLETEQRGQAMTTHMTLRSRYDAAMALLNEEFPDSPALQTLSSLHSRIVNDLAGERNTIVHSRILMLPTFRVTLRKVYKARGKIKEDTVKVDPGEYKRVSDDILSAANQLLDALNEVIELVRQKGDKVPAWLDRTYDKIGDPD